jgi:putative transcriptional regulator
VSKRFEFLNEDAPQRDGNIAPGSFLVATPALQTSGFERTVVFVLQHNLDGTFGAVINRPANQSIVANWSKQTGLEFARESIVQGGPLGGPVLAIHQDRPIAEVEISAGVCLSVDSKAIQKLSTQHESRYRIVLGIAGWEKDQLSREMSLGYWYHVEVDPLHVFDDHDLMWENFVREYGRQTLQTLVGNRHFPQNPHLN